MLLQWLFGGFTRMQWGVFKVSSPVRVAYGQAQESFLLTITFSFPFAGIFAVFLHFLSLNKHIAWFNI